MKLSALLALGLLGIAVSGAGAGERPHLLVARPGGAHGPLIAYDVPSGRRIFGLPSGIASADGHVFAVARAGAVVLHDARNGARRRTLHVEGGWTLRALSPRGRFLGLQRRDGPTTRFAVVDARTGSVIRRIALRGRLEIDALSGGGRDLYLIQHLAGDRGTAYTVLLYEFDTHRLSKPSALGPEGDEPMAGYAWRSIPSPDGRWLLTLYLNTTKHVAFVHALDLRARRPACIDLPSGAGDIARLADYSLALAPDEHTLVAANGSLGVAARIDLRRLRVVGTTTLGGRTHTGAAPAGAVSPDGRTFAYASGRAVWVGRIGARSAGPPSSVPARVVALGFGRDGQLFAARSDGRVGAVAPRRTTSSAGGDALALLSRGSSAQLVHADPRSLRVSGPRVDLGRHDTPWARSPDGSQLLVGSGRVSTLRVVDVAASRVQRDVAVPGSLVALTWPAARAALAVVSGTCCPGRLRLVVVDPTSGRLRRSRALGTRLIVRAAPAPHGLVLLLAPPKLGAPRLLRVDADGSIRSVLLRRLPAGYRSDAVAPANSLPTIHSATPGLAVDPSGRRAVVVNRKLAAEIDLRTLTVRYHPLTSTRTPACDCGYTDGSTQDAAWVAPETVAVSGFSDHVLGRGAKRHQAPTKPLGLRLLDTRAWTMRTVDSGATSFVRADDGLLTTDQLGSLRAYRSDGAPGFQLDVGGTVTAFGTHAYIGLADQYRAHPVTVIDTQTGRVVARPTVPGALTLLGAPRPCWC